MSQRCKACFPLVVLILLLWAQVAQAYELTDITGHWAEDDIRDLIDLGAITGYPDRTYRPENSITRAEFSSVIRGALALPEAVGDSFSDTAGHWAEGRIEALVQAGVINEHLYGDTYSPDGYITREEIAMMTVRMLGSLTGATDIPFSDASEIGWGYETYVAEAYGRGIIRGYPDGTFRPGGTATRAEAAVMAIRAVRIWVSEPPKVTSFYASHTSLIVGMSSELSWEVENASEIIIQPDVGEVDAQGSTSVSPSSTTTYILTATNLAGSVEAATEISVSPIYVLPKPGITLPPPSISFFESDKSLLSQGLSATLSWEVQGLASVTIEPGIGSVAPSGSIVVTPMIGTTYTITAENNWGTASKSTEITIVEPWVSQGHWVRDGSWRLSPLKRDVPSDRLWVGMRGDGSYHTSAVYFDDLKHMPSGSVIESARLELYQYETRYSFSALIGAYLITTDYWLESDWFPQSEMVPESIAEVWGGSRWVSWGVTQMVQDWVSGQKPNYGTYLKPASPLSQTTRFYASSYTMGDPLRPRLVVEYYLP